MADFQGVGAAIKARREALGLTQSQLAARVGVHKQSVVKWEAGDRGVRYDRLPQVAIALDTTVAALFGEDVARRVASDTDRRLARLENFVARLREMLNELDAEPTEDVFPPSAPFVEELADEGPSSQRPRRRGQAR